MLQTLHWARRAGAHEPAADAGRFPRSDCGAHPEPHQISSTVQPLPPDGPFPRSARTRAFRRSSARSPIRIRRPPADFVEFHIGNWQCKWGARRLALPPPNCKSCVSPSGSPLVPARLCVTRAARSTPFCPRSATTARARRLSTSTTSRVS